MPEFREIHIGGESTDQIVESKESVFDCFPFSLKKTKKGEFKVRKKEMKQILDLLKANTIMLPMEDKVEKYMFSTSTFVTNPKLIKIFKKWLRD